MRYVLFFLVLFLHSYSVFAQEPVCQSQGYTPSHCANLVSSNSVPSRYAFCKSSTTEGLVNYCYVPKCPAPKVNSPANPINCVCDTGQVEYTYDLLSGATTCGPSCTAPQIANIVTNGASVTVSCIDPTTGSGGDCPPEQMIFDPVTQTNRCPGSSDTSSSTSCPSGYPAVNGSCPVCPSGYNGDGTCADDSPTSQPTSTPTSAPSSSPSNGDDDDPESPGGGGGGNGNGGSNNGGGGSASSAATSSPSSGSNISWTPHSGYGNWIPVASDSNCPNKFQDQSGQWWCAGGNSDNFGSAVSASSRSGACDPTSTTYFTCITSGAGSGVGTSVGSNSSWTPVSGYGNWIPVSEDSPCPNKFKDASGKWWCAGGATGGGGGGSGGAGGSSGSAAATSTAAGECDQTASNYLDCISQGKTSSRASSSTSSVSSSASNSSGSSSGAFSSLGEKGEFDGEASEKSLEDLKEELDKKIADIKADIKGEFGGAVSGSGTIQDFCKNIRGNDVCFGMKKFEDYLEPISSAIFLVACFLAFAIVLRK